MRSVASCSSILIVSPNWLGDFVMALPAVTRFHRAHPGVRLSILCKPFLRDLWTKVDGIAPERVFTFPPQGVKKSFLQTRETFAMGRQLRASGFEAAVLFPNSFRSALIAAVAGIPVRRGTGLHARRFLINDPVRFSAGETRTLHQSREYLKLLCGDSAGDLSETGFASARPGFPAGAVPPAFLQGAPLIGVIPGAARGDSKRWPFFAQAIVHIAGACPEARFVCLGTDKERPLCEQTLQEAVALAPQLAGRLVNAAGTTRGTADFLYSSGAKELHIRLACPPLLFGCPYLNFSRSSSELELIARRKIAALEGEGYEKNLQAYTDPDSPEYAAMVEAIRSELQFTSLRYNRLDDMLASTGLPSCKCCTYCWNGKK